MHVEAMTNNISVTIVEFTTLCVIFLVEYIFVYNIVKIDGLMIWGKIFFSTLYTASVFIATVIAYTMFVIKFMPWAQLHQQETLILALSLIAFLLINVYFVKER